MPLEDVDSLITQIKDKVTDKYRNLKDDLFQSNGTILGRDWKDLSENYKPFKYNEIGRIYPMNIFTGDMLQALLEKALVIESENLDGVLKFNVSVDTERMGIEYADDANKEREFISFSDEEKEQLVEITFETIKEYFGV